jgi:hypothetical protein
MLRCYADSVRVPLVRGRQDQLAAGRSAQSPVFTPVWNPQLS